MDERVQEMILSIPSDFKFLGAVDAAVQDLAREYAFTDGAINDLSTALIEACSNAIEHGNGFSPDKRVTVSLSFGPGGFVGRVCDEGPGFDFESVLACEEPPAPLSERGRGLLIMRAFTDALEFSFREGRGLCVELRKANREALEHGAA